MGGPALEGQALQNYEFNENCNFTDQEIADALSKYYKSKFKTTGGSDNG